MGFRREAMRLIERQVAVDTVKKTYKGRLRTVERDYIVISVMRTDNKQFDQIIIRTNEIIALSAL
jgi:hypothetical protein